MFVKNHDFSSLSHLPLIESQEPPFKSTISKNFLFAAQQFKKSYMIGYRAGLSTNIKQIEDQYQLMTFSQSLVYIAQIVKKLQSLGLQKGDRVAIYSRNSPLWLLSDLAVSFLGCVTVPLYDTLGVENIIYCIEMVQARCILVSHEFLANLVASAVNCKIIEKIVCFDAIDIELLKQQSHVVYAKISDNNIEISDENSSVFSISQEGKEDQKETQQIDFTTFKQVDEIIVDTEKLITLNIKQFSPSESEVVDAREFLTQLEKTIDVQPQSVNSIVFTSGTVGKPKGVVYSHQNLISGAACLARRFMPYHLADSGEQSTFLSYLPLAHAFDRNTEHLCLFRGILIYYSCGSVNFLGRDLQLAQPTILIGVPRVLVKIHKAIQKRIERRTLFSRTMFKTAFWLKFTCMKYRSEYYRTGKMPCIDHIFSQIRQALGGKLEMIICGSSTLPITTKQFFEVASCARLGVGYGLTEISIAGLYNYCGQKLNDPNQLGFCSSQMMAKVVDRQDQCEFTLTKHRIGELLIKGVGVALGYVDEKFPRIQPIVDRDGYFHTGDLVKINTDGSVSFMRRIGLVVKLQQGEFVDLEAVESALESSPLILTALVHAEPARPAPVCVASVDKLQLVKLVGAKTADQFMKGDRAAELRVERVVYGVGEKVVRERGLKGYNIPKAYKVYVGADWTTVPGLFTQNQKKMHGKFVKKFSKDIYRLWILAGERDAARIEKKEGKEGLIWGVVVLVLVALLLIKR